MTILANLCIEHLLGSHVLYAGSGRQSTTFDLQCRVHVLSTPLKTLLSCRHYRIVRFDLENTAMFPFCPTEGLPFS